jgi:hypothetical protein
LGYSNYFLIENIEDLRSFWNQIIYENGPSFVEAKISIGSRPDLGRPNVPPEINKMNFMEAVIEKNT